MGKHHCGETNAQFKQSVAILGQGNLADIPEKSYLKRSMSFENPALRTSTRCGGGGGEMPDGSMLNGSTRFVQAGMRWTSRQKVTRPKRAPYSGRIHHKREDLPGR